MDLVVILFFMNYFYILVAKQCLESAFNFSTSDCGDVPDLLSLFELHKEVG